MKMGNETMNELFTLENRIRCEILSFSGIMGIYADDLKGHVIRIHPEEEYETASTIKSFILADLYSQVHEGKKSLDEMLIYDQSNFINGSGILRDMVLGLQLTAKNMAVLMITLSDNIATNILIDYLGLEHINETIQKLGLAGTRLHRKLGIEGWDKLGTTTPEDYGKLFAMLARRELVSPEASDDMLEIFKKQKYNSTLSMYFPPFYLDEDNYGDIDPQVFIASKSGSMNKCRNDGGIVGTPYGKYVIAIFTKEFKDKQYHKEHESHIYGARASRLLFDQYMALEGRFEL